MQDVHPKKTLMMKLMLQEPIMNLNPAVIRATATSHKLLHPPGMALLPGMDMYWESEFRGDDVEEWIEYEFMAPVKVTSVWLTTDVAHHPSNPYNSIQVKNFLSDDWKTLTFLPTLRWYTNKNDGTISLRLDASDSSLQSLLPEFYTSLFC